jgi:hypothetical protein
MKRKYWLLLLLFAMLLNGSPVLADGDFYVVSGGGTKGKILKTQLFTSNYIDTTLGTGTWAQLPAVSWSYQKVSPTSKLIITYQDNLGATSLVSIYQIRVNDAPSDGGVNAACLICSNTNGSSSHSATGLWSNLPAGYVTLSIWHFQVNATQCIRNIGGMTTTVLVMEVEQ